MPALGADAVVLALPNGKAADCVAAFDAVGVDPVIIDLSADYRFDDGWYYGLPELTRQHYAGQTRISNPGCYPTGAIGLIRPLRAAGILPDGYPVSVNAVSGYSGGGKQMIAQMEDVNHPEHLAANNFLYGLTLKHKHVPEMQTHGLLDRAPLFAPSVGRFAQGMIVSLPLHLWALPGAPKAADIHAALADHYARLLDDEPQV